MLANAVFAGTSISDGNHNGGVSHADKVATLLPTIVVTKVAVPSSTLDSANQGAAADALIVAGVLNILFVEFGVNDGIGGVSAATFSASLATWCASRRSAGFKVVVETMLPCGSYDSVAFRAAINKTTRFDRSFYDRIADFGDPSTEMGLESAKNDALLYSDTIHPTDLGYDKLATSASGLITRILTGADRGVRTLRM